MTTDGSLEPEPLLPSLPAPNLVLGLITTGTLHNLAPVRRREVFAQLPEWYPVAPDGHRYVIEWVRWRGRKITTRATNPTKPEGWRAWGDGDGSNMPYTAGGFYGGPHTNNAAAAAGLVPNYQTIAPGGTVGPCPYAGFYEANATIQAFDPSDPTGVALVTLPLRVRGTGTGHRLYRAANVFEPIMGGSLPGRRPGWHQSSWAAAQVRMHITARVVLVDAEVGAGRVVTKSDLCSTPVEVRMDAGSKARNQGSRAASFQPGVTNDGSALQLTEPSLEADFNTSGWR
jgi:hypothetical protein